MYDRLANRRLEPANASAQLVDQSCPAHALHALLAGKLKLNYRGFAGERRQDPERKDYLQSLTSQISPKPIPGIKEQSGTTTIASETVVVQYRPLLAV